jgi:hypothetical protein
MDDLARQILEKRTGEPAREKIRRLFGKAGLTEDYARKMLAGMRLYIEKTIGSSDKIRNEETVKYYRDGTREYVRDISLSDEEAADPATVMRKMGFDPLLWELIDCKLRKGNWDSTIKNNDGEPVTVTNYSYSVTIKVRPITNSPLTLEAISDAISKLKMPAVQPVKRAVRDGKEYMFEPAIVDLHLGKLAWGKETGDADFDLKIAAQLYKATIDDLLSKVVSSNYNIGKIVYQIGQDFYHFDNPKVQTTAGTQLDSDTRWKKMYACGLELLIETIEKFRQLAPVLVLWVPGNHDEELSYTAVVALKHIYANADDVEVDASPLTRKYILWKNNLIGFAHGRDEGKRLSGLMQVEAPDKWAASKVREFHLGDIHHDKLIEENGIEFRWMGTITAVDAWSAYKGYVTATRKAQGILWGDYGIEAIFNSYIEKEIEKVGAGQE